LLKLELVILAPLLILVPSCVSDGVILVPLLNLVILELSIPLVFPGVILVPLLILEGMFGVPVLVPEGVILVPPRVLSGR